MTEQEKGNLVTVKIRFTVLSLYNAKTEGTVNTVFQLVVVQLLNHI